MSDTHSIITPKTGARIRAWTWGVPVEPEALLLPMALCWRLLLYSD